MIPIRPRLLIEPTAVAMGAKLAAAADHAAARKALDQLNAHQREEVAAYDKGAVQVAGAPSSKH